MPFRASAQAEATTAVTTLTIAKPAGVVAGDVMYAFILISGNASSDPANASWTFLLTVENATVPRSQLSVLRRVAGGAEPADWAFSWTTADQAEGSILAFSDVDNATPEDAATTSSTGNSATPSNTGITTATAGAMLLLGVGQGGTGADNKYSAWSAPLVEDTDLGPGVEITLGTAYGVQAAAGASGAKQATSTQSSPWETLLLALRPAGRRARGPAVVRAPALPLSVR